jgi:hypothetical protein
MLSLNPASDLKNAEDLRLELDGLNHMAGRPHLAFFQSEDWLLRFHKAVTKHSHYELVNGDLSNGWDKCLVPSPKLAIG